MLDLFQQTFAPFGHCTFESRKVFLTGFDWQVKVELDNTFEFLIDKPVRIPTGRRALYEFLAGLSDSDGSWIVFEGKGKSALALVITSEDKRLLLLLKEALEKECVHAYVYLDRRAGTTKIMHGVAEVRQIRLTKDVWRLDIHRREEVRMLARRLLPLSHHQEKIRRMCLVLDEGNEDWVTMGPKIQEMREETREETIRTIKAAEIDYKARGKGRQMGVVG